MLPPVGDGMGGESRGIVGNADHEGAAILMEVVDSVGDGDADDGVALGPGWIALTARRCAARPQVKDSSWLAPEGSPLYGRSPWSRNGQMPTLGTRRLEFQLPSRSSVEYPGKQERW